MADSEQVAIVVPPNIEMKQRHRALNFDRRRDLIMGLVWVRTPHCLEYGYLPHDHHGFNFGQRSRSHHAKSAAGRSVLRLRFRIIRRVLCTDTVSIKIGGTTTCLVPRSVPPTPRWSAT